MDKLFSYAINEWLNDIKKNQLPGLLGGVGPIHSLVQLGEFNTCSEPSHRRCGVITLTYISQCALMIIINRVFP